MLGAALGLGMFSPLAQASAPACAAFDGKALVGGPSSGCSGCGDVDVPASAVGCTLSCATFAPVDAAAGPWVAEPRTVDMPLAAVDAPREWLSAPEPYPPRIHPTV